MAPDRQHAWVTVKTADLRRELNQYFAAEILSLLPGRAFVKLDELLGLARRDTFPIAVALRAFRDVDRGDGAHSARNPRRSRGRFAAAAGAVGRSRTGLDSPRQPRRRRRGNRGNRGNRGSKRSGASEQRSRGEARRFVGVSSRNEAQRRSRFGGRFVGVSSRGERSRGARGACGSAGIRVFRVERGSVGVWPNSDRRSGESTAVLMAPLDGRVPLCAVACSNVGPAGIGE